ncbi:MAG: hypothetical protein Q9O74_03765, partial [Planctomycetota bacterium]|nr:hypothetical protein [Planctomycetota bacterium]
MPTIRLLCCLFMVACSGLCAQAQDNNIPSTPESVALVDLLSDTQADRRAVRSFYSMSFDSRSFDRLAEIDADAKRRLEATDFAALDQQGRI